MIEYSKFTPHKGTYGLIGYVDFHWNKQFKFNNIGVYKLREPKGHIKIRLRYPEGSHPAGETYNEILDDVNSYICANYWESINVSY